MPLLLICVTCQLICFNFLLLLFRTRFQLHSLSCCLKAICTADGAQGIEQLRLACGGHGYMECSNLPSTYGMVTAACTYEGENTVLLLQTARLVTYAQFSRYLF